MSTGPQVTNVRVICVGWCDDGLIDVSVNMIDDQVRLRRVGVILRGVGCDPRIAGNPMSSMRIPVTAVATVERVRAAKGSAPTTSSVADPHLVLRGRSRAGDDGRVRTGVQVALEAATPSPVPIRRHNKELIPI